jgi:hypothetical protein
MRLYTERADRSVKPAGRHRRQSPSGRVCGWAAGRADRQRVKAAKAQAYYHAYRQLTAVQQLHAPGMPGQVVHLAVHRPLA